MKKSIVYLLGMLLFLIEFFVFPNYTDQNKIVLYKASVTLLIMLLINTSLLRKSPFIDFTNSSNMSRTKSLIAHLSLNVVCILIVLICWAWINNIHDGFPISFWVTNNVSLIGTLFYLILVEFIIKFKLVTPV